MLDAFAQRLARSPGRRHALFLGASLFTLLFVGYHFGTFDQTIHIPFLKKYADPTLYPGDPFFELRFQHYSYFWLLFLPFYRAGVLEVAMLVIHFLATYLTFWMLWALADTLFHSPLATLLSTLAFMVPHIGFAGFPIFEFSLLNRTFVLPFLLMAILLFLRGRVVWAFALLGVLYNLAVTADSQVPVPGGSTLVGRVDRIGGPCRGSAEQAELRGLVAVHASLLSRASRRAVGRRRVSQLDRDGTRVSGVASRIANGHCESGACACCCGLAARRNGDLRSGSGGSAGCHDCRKTSPHGYQSDARDAEALERLGRSSHAKSFQTGAASLAVLPVRAPVLVPGRASRPTRAEGT